MSFFRDMNLKDNYFLDYVLIIYFQAIYGDPL